MDMQGCNIVCEVKYKINRTCYPADIDTECIRQHFSICTLDHKSIKMSYKLYLTDIRGIEDKERKLFYGSNTEILLLYIILNQISMLINYF